MDEIKFGDSEDGLRKPERIRRRFDDARDFEAKRKEYVETSNPKIAQQWVREILLSQSQAWHYYRAMAGAGEVDAEADILALKKHFGKTDEDRYKCRTIFRFLLRRFAFCGAWEIHRHMIKQQEKWTWSSLRFLGFCLPRLFMGVVAGYILQFNDEMIDLVKRVSEYPREPLVLGVTIVFLFCISFYFVQREVGRIAFPRLLLRSMIVLGIGLVQTGLCGLAVLCLGTELRYPTGPSFAVHSGLLALLLGLLFQNFWQDGSIGDPL